MSMSWISAVSPAMVIDGMSRQHTNSTPASACWILLLLQNRIAIGLIYSSACRRDERKAHNLKLPVPPRECRLEVKNAYIYIYIYIYVFLFCQSQYVYIYIYIYIYFFFIFV